MRLRRLEVVFIGVTLAFAIFMGGFFAGRSWSTVNITPVTAGNTQYSENSRVSVLPHGQLPENPNGPAASVSPADPPGLENSVSLPAAASPEEQQASIASETQPEAGAPRGGDGKININVATQSELTDLPGIGSVLASRIVDHRRQHGNFERIEDIRNVSGIGEKRYEAIQDKITVG